MKAVTIDLTKKKIKNPKSKVREDRERPLHQNLALSLQEAIDESLAKKQQGKFKKSKGFGPSKNSECARFWVYSFRGAFFPADFNGRVQRIFDNGHAVHDRIYKYLDNMGVLEQTEHPIFIEVESEKGVKFPIHGFVDAIIEWKGRSIVEVKSISEVGFMHRKLRRAPKDEHIKQVKIYLHIMDLDIGYVIYENKNTQELLVLTVEKDDEYIRKLFNKYGKFWQAYQDGILPKRPYKSKDSAACKYCPLRDPCWEDVEGDKKV